MAVITGNKAGLLKFKPAFTTALYKTEVDVIGNHLSGLLIIKKMPDSTLRLHFSSETGFTFFDFEFAKDGVFTVKSVVKQMDKKAVVTTLRKDFELILMDKLDTASATVYKSDGSLYYVFPQTKGFNFYVTDSTGKKLLRMERASNKKVVVQAITQKYSGGMPDTIGITHKNFNFTIGLKRIER